MYVFLCMFVFLLGFNSLVRVAALLSMKAKHSESLGAEKKNSARARMGGSAQPRQENLLTGAAKDTAVSSR